MMAFTRSGVRSPLSPPVSHRDHSTLAAAGVQAEASHMGWFGAFKQWFHRPSRAEQRLLHRCFGDAAQMERLIAHEQVRRPQLSRAAASEAALDRWSRD